MMRDDAAIEDFDQVIENVPDFAAACSERGLVYKAQGRYDLALADYRTAIELRPYFAEARMRLAWLLSTCPEEQLRDGSRAVDLARSACQLSGAQDEAYLDTLAAAYAEAGDFEAACSTVDQVLALAPEEIETGVPRPPLSV